MMDFEKIKDRLGLQDVNLVIRRHKFSTKHWGTTRHVVDMFYVDLYLGPDVPAEVADRILLHELVHVQQHIQGRVKYDGVNKKWIWYGPQTDDPEPWETEADEIAEKILKELE